MRGSRKNRPAVIVRIPAVTENARTASRGAMRIRVVCAITGDLAAARRISPLVPLRTRREDFQHGQEDNHVDRGQQEIAREIQVIDRVVDDARQRANLHQAGRQHEAKYLEYLQGARRQREAHEDERRSIEVSGECYARIPGRDQPQHRKLIKPLNCTHALPLSLWEGLKLGDRPQGPLFVPQLYSSTGQETATSNNASFWDSAARRQSYGNAIRRRTGESSGDCNWAESACIYSERIYSDSDEGVGRL